MRERSPSEVGSDRQERLWGQGINLSSVKRFTGKILKDNFIQLKRILYVATLRKEEQFSQQRDH